MYCTTRGQLVQVTTSTAPGESMMSASGASVPSGAPESTEIVAPPPLPTILVESGSSASVKGAPSMPIGELPPSTFGPSPGSAAHARSAGLANRSRARDERAKVMSEALHKGDLAAEAGGRRREHLHDLR